MKIFAYSRAYPIDGRFSVKFSLDNGRLDCVWDPHMPKGRKWRSILPAYRVARNDFILSLGLNTLVIEI